MNLWTKLTALEPSVAADLWQSATDIPAPCDTLDGTSDGYHDRPRDLEAFAEVSKAPDAKRIKKGVAEDDELDLLARVARILDVAAAHGVVLSAPRVIAFLRSRPDTFHEKSAHDK